ncbi:hypothetical protein BCR43DRAFT_495284 [Syncephalastrum racemosum]|uniref:F-box domain-containing protein n=1 Tax=Syncephalastrum racemosum TaxID=13706 RepID=A0A1X2H5L2_SYNRA|nr:hypothetical protein BCR43DRAFT_495284 [Syncephalastrum racemosum]
MQSILNWPPELLQHVLEYLSQTDLARLCLTSKAAYVLSLPALYQHLRLDYKAHLCQLEKGVARRPLLKHTLEHVTLRLTISNAQNRNFVWLAHNCSLQRLLGLLTRLQVFTLTGFQAVPVQCLFRVIRCLPAPSRIELHYCDLVMETPTPTKTVTETTELRLHWTDFTEQAIRGLFAGMPYLEHIELGANRNRIAGINTAAIWALGQSCPLVRHLSLSLQQVDEEAVCDLIARYGPQLQQLALRCDGSATLWTVARHATHVENLVIRAGNSTPLITSNTSTAHPPSSATRMVAQRSTSVHIRDRHIMGHSASSHASASVAPGSRNSRAPLNPMTQATQQHLQEEEGEEEDERPDDGSITGILRRCRELVRLEMVAWLRQDIPSVVWHATETVRRRRCTTTIIPAASPMAEKTLSLDREELQEIRRQFI